MAYYVRCRFDVFVDGIEIQDPSYIVSLSGTYGWTAFSGNLPISIGSYSSTRSLGSSQSRRVLVEANITGEYDFSEWTLGTFLYNDSSESNPLQQFSSYTNPSASSYDSGFDITQSLGSATSSTYATRLHFRLYLTTRKKTKTVILNPNGGRVDPSEVVCIETYANAVAIVPEWDEEHFFDGWHSAAVDGYMITANTAVTDDSPSVIFAHWTSTPVPPKPEGDGSLLYDVETGRLLHSAYGNMVYR